MTLTILIQYCTTDSEKYSQSKQGNKGQQQQKELKPTVIIKTGLIKTGFVKGEKCCEVNIWHRG